MRALVTGISGFAGGYLAEHLLGEGDEVLGASPDRGWADTSAASLRGRVELLPWEMTRDDGLSSAARQAIERLAPEVIFHLAALSLPEDCGEQQPTPGAVAMNVGATRRVLELARSLPSRPRVLFTSSNHVYAPVDLQSPLVTEEAPLGPRRGYGRTKVAAEAEVRRAVAHGECDAVIARSFQHTGPRQNARMMLPQWVEQFVSERDPVAVYTLNAWLDLSDVRDVVRAYRLLALHGKSGEVYNIGSGVARRSGDVLEMVRRMAGPERRVVETRPGFRHEPIADVSRLRSRTGWQPRIPLAQTVADTLAWWQSRINSPSPSGRGPG